MSSTWQPFPSRLGDLFPLIFACDTVIKMVTVLFNIPQKITGWTWLKNMFKYRQVVSFAYFSVASPFFCFVCHCCRSSLNYSAIATTKYAEQYSGVTKKNSQFVVLHSTKRNSACSFSNQEVWRVNKTELEVNDSLRSCLVMSPTYTFIFVTYNFLSKSII